MLGVRYSDRKYKRKKIALPEKMGSILTLDLSFVRGSCKNSAEIIRFFMYPAVPPTRNGDMVDLVGMI